jgi:hypothetical protein
MGVGTTDNLSTLTVQAKAPFTLSGTVSTTADSAEITGTSTKFLSEVAVGDSIALDGSSYTIAVVAVASDTSLTASAPLFTVYTGVTAIVSPSAARVDDSGANPQVIVDDQGNVGIGTVAPIGQLHVHSPCDFGGSQLMLSYDKPPNKPGVLLSVGDLDQSGWPTLTCTLYDGANTMVDTVRFDINGMWTPGMITVSPTIVSDDYTISPGDQYVYVIAGTGPKTITLPTSNGNQGRVLWIFKIDGSANAVEIAHVDGDTINGATGNKSMTTPYGGAKLVALLTSSSYTWVASALPPL